MKRRTLLKNAASASLLTVGATSAAAASVGSEIDPDDLPEDPVVSVVEPQTGERVSKPLSQTDATLSDCCIEEDGCGACACYCCVC